MRIGVIQPQLPAAPQCWGRQLDRIVLIACDYALIERAVASIADPQLKEKACKVFEHFLKISLWKRRHGFKECPKYQALYRGHPSLYPICRVPLRRFPSHN